MSDLEWTIRQCDGHVEIGDLPVVEADAVQLRQIFQNLISNSLKYRREGERPVIKVHGSLNGAAVEVTVEDNGIGFNEEYTDRIFKPFQRLHGRSAYDGIGMGLAICRKIIERHGGSITARSVPGEVVRRSWSACLQCNPCTENSRGRLRTTGGCIKADSD